MKFKNCYLTLALSFASVGQSHAAVVYDESVAGDLSNVGAVPTVLTLSPGSNEVIGTTGRDTIAGTDRDYFTFTLAPNQRLTSLTVEPGTTVGGNFGFLGMQAGSQVTLSSTATTADGLLGWAHYGASDLANHTNLLLTMSVPDRGSSGFTLPLGPSALSFVEQDTSLGQFNYHLNLTVSAVPLPSSWLLGLAPLALLAARRRRAV